MAVLKVKSSTCTLGVYGDLGRYPLYIQRYVRIIKFWCHIVSSDNILVTYFYNNMVEACNNGATNWAGNVKSLLDNYGFSYVWNNPHVVNLSSFHLVFKERVIDISNKLGLTIYLGAVNWFYTKNLNLGWSMSVI